MALIPLEIYHRFLKTIESIEADEVESWNETAVEEPVIEEVKSQPASVQDASGPTLQNEVAPDVQHVQTQTEPGPTMRDMQIQTSPDVQHVQVQTEPATATISTQTLLLCNTCQGMFSSPEALSLHKIAEHRGVKRQQDLSPDRLDVQHVQTQTEPRPTMRDMQIQATPDIQHVQLQTEPATATISKQTLILCNTCQGMFSSAEALSLHKIAEHRGVKRQQDLSPNRPVKKAKVIFTCSICAKSYASRFTRDRHIRDIHEKKKTLRPKLPRYAKQIDDAKVSYPCVQCPDEFASDDARQKHVKLVHDRSATMGGKKRKPKEREASPVAPAKKSKTKFPQWL